MRQLLGKTRISSHLAQTQSELVDGQLHDHRNDSNLLNMSKYFCYHISVSYIGTKYQRNQMRYNFLGKNPVTQTRVSGLMISSMTNLKANCTQHLITTNLATEEGREFGIILATGRLSDFPNNCGSQTSKRLPTSTVVCSSLGTQVQKEKAIQNRPLHLKHSISLSVVCFRVYLSTIFDIIFFLTECSK